MALMIEPYRPDLEGAVRAYNQRLETAGVVRNMNLPEASTFPFFPPNGDGRLRHDYYLATENGHVRGGYLLTSHEVLVDGMPHMAGETPEMSSEVVLDRKYNLLVVRLVRHALGRQPLLLQPQAGPQLQRVFQAMGWRLVEVPLYLKVRNGFRFALLTPPLRKTRARAALMNAVAWSGAGWVGARLLHGLLGWRTWRRHDVDVEVFDEFGGWADELWKSSKAHYSFIAARDSRTLNTLYADSRGGFLKLKVSRRGRLLGWAVLSDGVMPDNRYTGVMRVGIIRDGLAAPADAAEVVRAVSAVLERRAVDVIVSNQSHPAWCDGLSRSGFVRGPSNYVTAFSPKMTARVEAVDPEFQYIHLNRDARRS